MVAMGMNLSPPLSNRTEIVAALLGCGSPGEMLWGHWKVQHVPDGFVCSVSGCVCTHVWVYVRMCEAKDRCWCLSQSHSTYLLRQDLSLKLELTDSTRPSGQKSRGTRPYPYLLGRKPLP